VDDKLSAKILKHARAQQQELEEENGTSSSAGQTTVGVILVSTLL